MSSAFYAVSKWHSFHKMYALSNMLKTWEVYWFDVISRSSMGMKGELHDAYTLSSCHRRSRYRRD